MHAIFVAIGAPAEQLVHADFTEILQITGGSHHRVVRQGNDFLGVVCAPAGTDPAVARTSDSGANLLLDGYVVHDDQTGLCMLDSASLLLRRTHTLGALESALGKAVAGSFNIAYANARRREFLVANDRMGSIPLYYAALSNGFLFSTNPIAILSTGLISSELDWTACASWIHIGYPLRGRHILRDLRLFPNNSIFRWQDGQGKISHLDNDPIMRLPRGQRLPTSTTAERVRRACQNISKISLPSAHLQSAGMDSRLILASLPEDLTPACFTYGRPDSTDVPIARQVATTRGASFHHSWPDGDLIANVLEPMFRASGLMVYPDRYVIAREISRRGFHSITDGFLGDVLLGGTYYRSDRHHNLKSRIGRFATLFLDQSISKIGLDKIADELFLEISDQNRTSQLVEFLSPDFAHMLQNLRPDIHEDIYAECKGLSSDHESLAILYRRFLLRNRSRQAIAQQGAMCRQFLQVLCPLSNDWRLLDACMDLAPKKTAYRRYYIQLFRDEYPEYAGIPYGDSLVPLRNPPIVHDYYKLMGKKSQTNHFFRHFVRTVPLSQNNWSIWMRSSSALREKLEDYLCQAGIIDREKLQAYLTRVSEGSVQASGKLFHLAAVARWMALGRETPGCP